MESDSTALWILLWKAFFILTVVVFVGMAVWVTIGGFRDIQRLFARLKEDDLAEPSTESEGDGH